MMEREKIRSVILPIVKSYGLQLVNFVVSSIGRYYIRVDVDRNITSPVPVPYPGSSVELNVLEKINKEISAVLAAYGPEGARYTIEVSSPGPHRPIVEHGELKYFIGHRVKVQLKNPVDGKKTITGRITAVSETDANTCSVELIIDGKKENYKSSQFESINLADEVIINKKQKKGGKKWQRKKHKNR